MLRNVKGNDVGQYNLFCFFSGNFKAYGISSQTQYAIQATYIVFVLILEVLLIHVFKFFPTFFYVFSALVLQNRVHSFMTMPLFF